MILTPCDVNIVVKLTYFRFDCLRSTKTHTIKYNHHVHLEQTRFATFVVLMTIGGSFGTCFDGLGIRTIQSENCYTSFLTLVQ